MIQNRAICYRLDPTSEQERKITQTFGCCRFVYNHYLEQQKANHEAGEKYGNRTACNNDCNRRLKAENPWLREVDKFALTHAIYALDRGFQNFFEKRGGYPRFKSRHHSRKAYTTSFTNGNIRVGKAEVKLPKLGNVRAVIHRETPEDGKIKQATISQDSQGHYMVSVLYAYEQEIPERQEPEKVLGMDYKSDGLYMDSDGRNCQMPHFYRNSQKKRGKAQRKLRKKEKGSANYQKQKNRIARISRKTANQRKDYLHKKSTEIANQYDLVCIEDLNLRNLANKHFGNGKATMDNGYGAFTTMLEYKLAERGKRLIRVSRWYPSSKTCSRCGAIRMMPLSQRTYHCTCGLVMDRDRNAAINIRREGMRIYQEESKAS